MKKRRKLEYCFNCGASLAEEINYCPSCGQENHDKTVSFRELYNDFISDFLSFDSKFFRTIVPLLFRPGFLTNDFNSGKRIKYVPPLRLYLIISFIYFFVLSFDNFNEMSFSQGSNNISITTNDQKQEFDNFEQIKEQAGDSIVNSLKMQLDTIPEGNYFDRFWRLQTIKLIEKGSTKSIMEQFVKSISIMMFFLMPVLALWLKLFYRKQKRFYVEHLMFSFHLHSFYFLIATVLLLFSLLIYDVGDYDIGGFVVLGYAFFALKNVYGNSIIKTIIKWLLLLFCYGALTFFVFLLVTVFVMFLFY